MELTFVQSSLIESAWEAEFQVTGDFNLHVERVRGGLFLVYQRTTESGDYGLVDDFGKKDGVACIDYDFSALVYPKWIKIVSKSKPSVAVVTFNA